MSREAKAERAELYEDSAVQRFLSKLFGEEIEKLEPAFDPDRGYTYPIVKSMFEDSEKAKEFLTRLSKAGIFEKKLHDKSLLCPRCGSHKISIRYSCPHCNSFDVNKSALIEHLKCGYIDTEEKFKGEGKLVCPRCKTPLLKPETDYRKAGIWCSCNYCSKSFDIPVPIQFCRNCGEEFTFEGAIVEDVFSYTLTNEAKQEASLGWILIGPLKDLLNNQGYVVKTSSFVKGKSGTDHIFDVVASRPEAPEKMTVIDLATSSDGVISEQPVIAMFAKIFDVSPINACLIAIPEMTDNGKRMAKLYNINLIEAKGPKEAVEAFRGVCLKQQKPWT